MKIWTLCFGLVVGGLLHNVTIAAAADIFRFPPRNSSLHSSLSTENAKKSKAATPAVQRSVTKEEQKRIDKNKKYLEEIMKKIKALQDAAKKRSQTEKIPVKK